MIKQYTYYDKATGQIVANVTGSLEPSLASYAVLEGLYPGDRYYIGSGVARERREMNLTINGTVVSGIPTNTTVAVNGAPYVISDGVVDITRPDGMPVHLRFTHPNYLTKEINL